MLNPFRLFLEVLATQPESPVLVVIPIYKPGLSDYEKISLDRCLKILGHYPMAAIAPEGLSLQNISFENINVKIEFFDKSYFESRDTYNRLLLSTDFYQKFLDYKYILIYQLDAFVFEDTLLDWCNEGFDYIGAPWLDEANIANWSQHISLTRKFFKKLKIPLINSVGNGGLSLRNVKKSIIALLFCSQRASTWDSSEDLFWSYFVTSYFPLFKVADRQTALKFAFETYPEKCYELNRYTLPFGCHAWEKYDIAFWRNIFKQLDYYI